MKNFLNTLLGFTPYWDYKLTNAINADSAGVYTTDKILSLSTKDKMNLQCDCLTDLILDGVRQLILYSFILNKPAGYKIFCEHETIYYEKVNKYVFEYYNIFSRKY